MLKTHSKSLLALALVPALFVAQLTGLAGSAPGTAHATSYTPAITLATSAGTLAAVPTGSTITVNGGSFQPNTTVYITLNAPNPKSSGLLAGSLATAVNGDNSESPSCTATGLANAQTQSVGATATGSITPVGFTLPPNTAPGAYLVSACDNSGNDSADATASFTVTNSNAALTVSPSASVGLGQQFQVSGGFNAHNNVKYYLEDFGQGNASNGTGFVGEQSVPLAIVSCNGSAPGAGAGAPTLTFDLYFTNASGGFFTLSTGPSISTPAIPFGSANTVLQTDLAALSNVGAGNVSVTGDGASLATEYVIEFTGTPASTFTTTQLTGVFTTLTNTPVIKVDTAKTTSTNTYTVFVPTADATPLVLTANGVNAGSFNVDSGTATFAAIAGDMQANLATDLTTLGLGPGANVTVTPSVGTGGEDYSVNFTGAALAGITSLTADAASVTAGVLVTFTPTTSYHLEFNASALTAPATSWSTTFTSLGGTATPLPVGASSPANAATVEAALIADISGPPALTALNSSVTNESVAGTDAGFTDEYVIALTGAVHGDTPAPNATGLAPLAIGVTGPGTGTVGGTPTTGQACNSGLSGYITATLQMSSAGATALLSGTFFDQAYTLVATGVSDGTAGATNTGVVFGGINLNHGGAVLSASPSPIAPGSTVTLSGSGFASNSDLTIYLGGMVAVSGGCILGSVPSSSASDIAQYGETAPINLGTACLLSQTILTDAYGNIEASQTVTIPASGIGTISGLTNAQLLAMDFAPANVTLVGSTMTDVEHGHRLNAATVSTELITTTAAATGALSLSTATAALGETVSFTGTGFTASTATEPQYATLSLAGSAGTCTSATPYGLPNVLVNIAGIASGTFTVPAYSAPNVGGCGLVAGDTVTVTLAGPTSSGSQSLSATFTIPSVSLTATTNGTTVTFGGTGFQVGESVSIVYVPTSSFQGATIPATFAVADPNGNIAGTAPAPSGVATGLYLAQAVGSVSGFTATANINFSVGGNLIVPTYPVSPGQVVPISGNTFSPGTGTLTINFSPTPITALAVTIGATGSFTTTITVPTGTISGTYQVVLTAAVPGATGNQQRTQPITVYTGKVVTLTATPATVAIGGTTQVNGTNYAPGETVTVALLYTGSGLAGMSVPGTSETFTADATGAISGTYTVKSTAAALVPGTYSLVATGSSGLTASIASFVVTGSTAPGVTSNVYFAEGYTGQTSAGAGANFAETISILNANNYTTTYTVTYFIEHAGASSTIPAPIAGSIGPDSVVERSVNTDAGSGVSVAAEVSSPAPLAATRIIARTTAAGTALDSSSSLGQQLNLSAAGPFSYYFASGDIMATSEEYLTILNPNSAAAAITLTVLPQTAVSSTTAPTVAPIMLSVPANSRLTEPIRKALQGMGFTQFGLAMASSLPVAAERVEYYGNGVGSGKYGATTSPASSSTSLQYIFAADTGTWPSTGGTDGTGADVSEVDIVNPAPATTSGSATVTVFFLDASGNPINSQQVQVDPSTRESVSVNDVVQTQAGVFSTVVTSDRPIYVERPTYYGGDPTVGGTFAANNPAGAPAGLTEVAFPYLDLTNGTASVTQTVYLYNPGTTTITVRGIYASASKTVVVSYKVAANSITAVKVNTDAASLTGPIGGVFQVVPSYSGSSEAFVALALSSQSGYAVVTGNQGTYPLAAALGL